MWFSPYLEKLLRRGRARCSPSAGWELPWRSCAGCIGRRFERSYSIYSTADKSIWSCSGLAPARSESSTGLQVRDRIRAVRGVKEVLAGQMDVVRFQSATCWP